MIKIIFRWCHWMVIKEDQYAPEQQRRTRSPIVDTAA